MNNEIVLVAVGVIQNSQEEVLIAERPHYLHQGGLWEFPGGKVNEHESVFNALKRELREEINIEVVAATAFMQVAREYIDKKVLLDVWCVTEFTGEPQGLEGQRLRWVPLSELKNYAVPAANEAIVSALLKV